MTDRRAQLHALFEAAVAAAAPAGCVPPHLPNPPTGRTVVVGAGKAAAGMAAAVEAQWPGPLAGLVVTRYGHGQATRRVAVIEAAHPVPDAAGRAAAGRMLGLVAGLGADDLVLCLLSGGGSALLVRPAAGLTLADKQAVTKSLLASGAAISEINCIRKHLSAIKGGRLAVAAAPARVVTLAISDVPGDDPAVIASGPTVPDPTSFADARAILAKYRIEATAADDETPKPGDPRLARAEFVIVARPRQALEAAAEAARAAGYRPVVLGDALEGEARDLARAHAALARDRATRPTGGARGWALLSGGEVTVTIRGAGRGGPNAEYLLALAIALGGAPGIHALAGDTDGIDGSEHNAGAVIAPDSLARARAAGLDPAARLADNDAYGFFEALGDLVVTGPTRTNVNDFRAILIDPRPA